MKNEYEIKTKSNNILSKAKNINEFFLLNKKLSKNQKLRKKPALRFWQFLKNIEENKNRKNKQIIFGVRIFG